MISALLICFTKSQPLYHPLFQYPIAGDIPDDYRTNEMTREEGQNKLIQTFDEERNKENTKEDVFKSKDKRVDKASSKIDTSSMENEQINIKNTTKNGEQINISTNKEYVHKKLIRNNKRNLNKINPGKDQNCASVFKRREEKNSFRTKRVNINHTSKGKHKNEIKEPNQKTNEYSKWDVLFWVIFFLSGLIGITIIMILTYLYKMHLKEKAHSQLDI